MARMYWCAIVFCLVLAVPVLVLGDSGESTDVDESDVLVLTKDNFDDEIQKNEFIFVEFYAPWCGHCKRLTPDWAKLATKAKEAGGKFAIAKLDATQAEEVAQKQGVRGYPSLKFFRNGKAVDYEGGRTIDELFNYASRKSGPASRLLASAEEVAAFLSNTGSKILGYFTDSEAHEDWLHAASHLEDFHVGHVTDSSLFGEHKEKTFAIHKEDGEKAVHDKEWSRESILDFTSIEGHPLVDDLAQKIWQRSQNTKTPLFAGFKSADNKEHTSMFKELAKKFKGKVLFSESAQGDLAKRWGATGDVLPTGILVQWLGADPKFTVYDEDGAALSLESAEAFINDALAGSYKSFKKSDPVPEKNNGPVKIVVGKNYDQVVKDSSKDVFVEFYAPWCGHCKKLSPIWDELGEAFEDDESIVIAKMDATTNATPDELDIKGFPTLIFFPANDKTGVPYSGERDLDNLAKFVKEHHTQKSGTEKAGTEEKAEL